MLSSCTALHCNFSRLFYLFQIYIFLLIDVFNGCFLIQLKLCRLRKKINKRNAKYLPTLRSLIEVPTPTSHRLLVFRRISTQDILNSHSPFIKSYKGFLSKTSSNFDSNKKIFSMFLLKFFVTDDLLFEFLKSLHCSF